MAKAKKNNKSFKVEKKKTVNKNKGTEKSAEKKWKTVYITPEVASDLMAAKYGKSYEYVSVEFNKLICKLDGQSHVLYLAPITGHKKLTVDFEGGNDKGEFGIGIYDKKVTAIFGYDLSDANNFYILDVKKVKDMAEKFAERNEVYNREFKNWNKLYYLIELKYLSHAIMDSQDNDENYPESWGISEKEYAKKVTLQEEPYYKEFLGIHNGLIVNVYSSKMDRGLYEVEYANEDGEVKTLTFSYENFAVFLIDKLNKQKKQLELVPPFDDYDDLPF